MFCKRVVKEENIDGKKIRGIIDELDSLKRENTLLGWTSLNQTERIESLEKSVREGRGALEGKNEEIEEKLKEIEFKGKDLLGAEKSINRLRRDNREFAEKKALVQEKFEQKAGEAKKIAANTENEKKLLLQNLATRSTKNHKLNQELGHFSAKLAELETTLTQKIRLEKSVNSTNHLFKKSASKLQNLITSIQDTTPSKRPYSSTTPQIQKSSYKTPRKSASKPPTLSSHLTPSIKKNPTTQPSSPPFSDDIILDEIENNYKGIEKDKIIEQLKLIKSKIFKESIYKDEKTSELNIH
jgi:chromosome segregation ATPase